MSPDLNAPMQADEARAMTAKLEPLLAQVEAILREHGASYLSIHITARESLQACPDMLTRSMVAVIRREGGDVFALSESNQLVAEVGNLSIIVSP